MRASVSLRPLCGVILGLGVVLVGSMPIVAQPAGAGRAEAGGERFSEQNKTLYAVSTAHLDTQWRWTIQDTITRFIPKTLHGNFELFEGFPNYTFSFEGAFRYMLMREYYPEDYARLKEYIRGGRWRVCGSSVDAGDVNVPSPESLMRQVLYGNGFFEREFGKTSCDIYLPDCFGFGYALPSVAAHCGLKGFSTQKLSWGSAVDVPFSVGVWEGPDGNSVIAALRPGGYTANIRNDMSRDQGWLRRIDGLGDQSGVYVGYRYFGVGDTGGAPDPESVQWVEESMASEGPLRVRNTGADQMYRDLTEEEIARLPRYNGELVMTTHGTGCYTSQAAMKRWNRKNELLADEAERAAVIADWLGATQYPTEKLREAWVRFLWHQFHDDLPGTSIPEAYAFSWNDEIISQNQFAAVLADSAGGAVRALDTRTEGVPVVVYNPLSIEREDAVEARVEFADGAPEAVRVFGPDGAEVASQLVSRDGAEVTVLFVAQVPSVGFAVYDVRAAEAPCSIDSGLRVSESSIENGRYRVRINEDGDVASIYDKGIDEELLSEPIRLQLLRDYSPRWPAWEVLYRDVMSDPKGYASEPVEVEIVESGPARAAIRLTRYAGDSTVIQEIRLGAGDAGDRVEFDTKIGWRTKGRMLKAAFPLSVGNSVATYDLGLGTIERPNNTERKYEVPAQQWADITAEDGSMGGAVLNDSRYGWDKPADNVLRLTLVRTPRPGGFSDQGSQDLGHHRLVYAICGHEGDWRSGDVPWQAARANQPLVPFQASKHDGHFGKAFSFLQLDNDGVAVRAIKRAERSDMVIVRLQELFGEEAEDVTVRIAGGIAEAMEVNGAEEPMGDVEVVEGTLQVDMSAYAPRTFAVKLNEAPVQLDGPVCETVTLPFNRDVVSSNANAADGDFDGKGHSLPAELLPAQLAAEGVAFELGASADGQNNAVECNGQRIRLPDGEYDHLYLLAAAADGDTSGTFMVDDRAVSLKVRDFTGFVGQWDSRLAGDTTVHNFRQLAPAYVKRQPIAWVGTHRHSADDGDEPYIFCYLFKYAIDISDGATTLRLPDDEGILVFAATVARNPNERTRSAAKLYEGPVQMEDLPPRIATLPAREPENPEDVVGGLRVSYYEGDWDTVAGFSDEKPAKAAEIATFGIPEFCREEQFGLTFEGYVDVPKDGIYTFYTASDDGSVLYIGDEIVVDNDGLHSHSENLGDIKLKAGKHAIRVLYFQGPVHRSLDVNWEGPDMEKGPIPEGALYRKGG